MISIHALLNLLNEFRKRDNMQGFQSISPLLHNFDKFNSKVHKC